MENYKPKELTEALRAINSIIHKCEKAQEKFPEGKFSAYASKKPLKSNVYFKSIDYRDTV